MPKKRTPEPIAELIAKLRTGEIAKLLSMVYAETEGLITLPESLKTGANALVYDLSILILAMIEKMSGKKARKWKELQVLAHRGLA